MKSVTRITDVLDAKVVWHEVSPRGVEVEAIINGVRVRLRMNDFPDNPLYTLIMGDESLDLEDAPECWVLPWRS